MKRFVEIPECWEEMTPRQWKNLLRLYFRLMTDPSITKDDFLLDLADCFLGRKKFIHPGQTQRYNILVGQVADSLDWVLGQDENGLIFLDYTSTINLLPAISGLIGPQSHGSDLLFGEYRAAVDLYNRFTLDHQEQDLNALVGVLYRPTDKRSDYSRRESFSRYRIDRYAERASHLPDSLKWGVYLWFGYFCRYIVDGGLFIIEGTEVSFSEVFGRQDNDPDAKADESIGMLAVLFSLADAGTFGNASQTDEAELFSVLLKLLHDKITNDKIKAR